MNLYHKLEEELKESRCTECDGRGKQDDWGFGDTFFNEWECERCNGTGVKPSSRLYTNNTGYKQ